MIHFVSAFFHILLIGISLSEPYQRIVYIIQDAIPSDRLNMFYTVPVDSYAKEKITTANSRNLTQILIDNLNFHLFGHLAGNIENVHILLS